MPDINCWDLIKDKREKERCGEERERGRRGEPAVLGLAEAGTDSGLQPPCRHLRGPQSAPLTTSYGEGW